MCADREKLYFSFYAVFFLQAEDGIRDVAVTGVQTCALPISVRGPRDLLGADAGGAALRGKDRHRSDAGCAEPGGPGANERAGRQERQRALAGATRATR